MFEFYYYWIMACWTQCRREFLFHGYDWIHYCLQLTLVIYSDRRRFLFMDIKKRQPGKNVDYRNRLLLCPTYLKESFNKQYKSRSSFWCRKRDFSFVGRSFENKELFEGFCYFVLKWRWKWHPQENVCFGTIILTKYDTQIHKYRVYRFLRMLIKFVGFHTSGWLSRTSI